MTYAKSSPRRHGTRLDVSGASSSGSLWGRAALAALAAVLLLATPCASALAADPPEPVEPLRCFEARGGVLLEWDLIVTILPIQGFTVLRDGDAIASLPQGSTSYFDPAPPSGSRLYELESTNWDGTTTVIGKCDIFVSDHGLRCKVEGRQVYLEWGPILIDVLILEFQVFRDGVLIARLPASELSHTDQAPDLGNFRYAVEAVTSPDSSFTVGRCAVDVSCFDLEVAVDGLEVALSWNVAIPQIEIWPPPELRFAIIRDDEVVGTTEEMKFVDKVPAPGIYAYRVIMDLVAGPDVPTYLVGACEVHVPGGLVPPPRRLVCIVLEIDPAPIPLDPAVGPAGNADGTSDAVDTDGDGVADSTLPLAGVSLRWENPVGYDRIIIARNKAIIATLQGDATGYTDHVMFGGLYLYSVTGVVGNLRSAPATCEVNVPPGFVPPPQGFRCLVLTEILDPTTGLPGDVVAPFDVVLLSWWNPVRYEKLVLLRDRGILAELPGDAMGYRDVAPPPGEHVYGIYGVTAWGEQSPIVTCWVFIGPQPVPPVEDLRCAVLDVTPDGTPGPAVALSWRNAARYDAIEILRNGDALADLPGSAQSYADLGVAPGIYLYEVVARIGNRVSRPAACEVVVPGPQPRNVLFFSPLSTSNGDSADDTIPPMPPLPGNRIVCRAANAEPLQGWSFGVASDPRFVVPQDTSIDGTDTQALNGGAGPDFLFLEILEDGEGVVMAVIIDTGTEPPFETLPSAVTHRIARIAYEAGPEGKPGQAYPIRYSSALGSPPVQVLYVVEGFEVTPATRAGWVSFPGPEFIRGDPDGSGEMEMADAIQILAWLFLGGPDLDCLQAADANGSNEVNIADPVFVLQHLYNGGPEPPPPYPDCGHAPVPLGCEWHEFCMGEAPPVP